jgi:hypothetical protein
MTTDTFIATALRPAFFLLPGKMDTPEARAMILAIALQESGLAKRRQFGKGPARSYLQFERAGVRGVLAHKASGKHARDVCTALDIVANGPCVHRAIEYQDVLAVCFARLLLWTLPKKLPPRTDPIEAWYQYLEAWRPGKPRETTRAAHYATAWLAVSL